MQNEKNIDKEKTCQEASLDAKKKAIKVTLSNGEIFYFDYFEESEHFFKENGYAKSSQKQY